MQKKLLSSTTLRALIIVYVMIAAGFVLVAQAHVASAQATQRDTLVIGLQNDMVNMNPWDPTTNSVWKAYQTEWGLEALFGQDPDFNIFPVLADPAKGGSTCPGGWTGQPGYCIDPTGLNVTVYIRTGVTFQDGVAFTADDVVFTYQTLAWGTPQNGIYQALWWTAPRSPIWSGNTTLGGMSHIGVEKSLTDPTAVIFHLSRPYALFFYDTMLTGIIPKHIWVNHMEGIHPLNLDTLAPITDTWDQSIDLGYGGAGAYDAAMGTGPFKIVYWLHNSNATIKVYNNYWGKGVASASHVWKGVNYPFYPQYVKTINFQVYGSLDVVSLALQKGEIDTLLWSLTPGFLTQVQYNPAIGVATSTDSGYFYMSFNLRKAPWNDLCLRQAISMTINKAYIVNTLMGGFGIAGTVPIGQTNSLYINTSAAPPSFDLAGAAAKLDSCGYRVGPTGFRTTPTGQPIVASILAPPKDYDPVRADAAIMISNNLKSIGLDIDAAPTSFDTIVTKAFTQPVSFDIYILGWSLGDFPETYICSFFCGNQDVNINPAGSNSAGYHNTVVDNLISEALVTVDTTKRVSLIKEIEGIVTNDIPWNILYYRKNINAYRTDTWDGWIPVSGGGSGNLGIYNLWSLVSLRPAGTVTGGGAAGALQVGLTVPDQVFARETVPMDVYVAQYQAPAGGASVSVNISYGSVSNVTTYTTDASGHVHFSWYVPVIQGNVIVNVQATKGTVTGSNIKVMEATIGPPMPSAQLLLSTTTPVIRPGQTATITASVTDGQGQPISGAPVTIDTTLVAGSVSPASGTTAAGGTVTFTYTAPSAASWPSPNGHLVDNIKAKTTVANTIAGVTQSAAVTMLVQNDAPPEWYVLSVSQMVGGVAGSGLVISPATVATVINVTVTNWAGAARSGVDVDVVASETNNITIAATTAGSNKTNAQGNASFTITETAAAIAATNNTNIWLRFQARNQAFATSDQLLLLVSDGTTAGYAARETFTDRTMAFNPDMAQNNATVTVWNQLGAPAAGVGVFFQIDYGPLGVPAQFPYTYDYGTPDYNSTPTSGASLDMNEAGGGSLGGVFQNSTGQGAAYGVENWFNDYEIENDFDNFATGTTIDACDPSTWLGGFDGRYFFNATSVTDALGQYTATFYGLPIRFDSGIQVRAYVSEPGKVGQAISDLWTQGSCGFAFAYANALRIDSGVVSQRAPMFGLGWIQTSKPIFTSQAPSVKLTGKFYAVDGTNPGPVQVFLTQGVGSAGRNVLRTFGGVLAADDNGYVNYTYTTPIVSLSQAIEFTFVDADAHWAFGGREQLFSGCTAPCFNANVNGAEFGDYWIAPTFTVLLSKVSFTFDIAYLYMPTTTAFLTVQVNQGLLPAGGTGTATVKVWSVLTGQPIAGASVWSGNATVETDTAGMATFNFTALTLGATENLVVATTPYGGAARGWFSYVSTLPVPSYSGLTVTAGAAGSPTYVNATVTNTLAVAGTMTVWLYVNNVSVAAKQVTLAASGSAAVSFAYVFAQAGTYQVAIGTSSQSVTISAPTQVSAGIDPVTAYALAGGLLVAGLVVGAVLGLFLSRRRKPPTMAPETAEESKAEGKAAEEELGPEEQL